MTCRVSRLPSAWANPANGNDAPVETTLVAPSPIDAAIVLCASGLAFIAAVGLAFGLGA